MSAPEDADPVQTARDREATTDAKPAASLPDRGRRIVKGLGLAFLAIVALVAVALFLLDTAPGRRFVADQIAALDFETGMRIEIGRIEGSLYDEMVIHDLSIKDPKGEFLFSPEVHVDWQPFAFLQNRIDVRALIAEHVVLHRLPQFRETPPSDEPLLPDLDIDIGKLQVERLIVEAPVTGARRVLTMAGQAHVFDGRAQVDLAVETISGPDRAGGDELRLVLSAIPQANRLAIDLALNAPEDGVIAALTGLTKRLQVDLKGRGTWEQWKGVFLAKLGGTRLARLAIAASDGTFSIQGTMQPSRVLSGKPAELLGPVAIVDVTASLEERSVALSAKIASDAVRIGANGLIDLSNNSFEDADLSIALLRPAILAEDLRGSGLRAALTLDGDFTAPRVQYAIKADRLLLGGLGLRQFRATGTAFLGGERLVVPIKARAARVTGLDSVAGGTLTDVRLAGDLAIDGARIVSDNIRMRSNRIDAGVVLLADFSTGFFAGAVDGRIDDYRVESVGIFDIQTDVDLKAAPGGFVIDGRVRARSSRLFNESLRNYLGGNLVTSADVRYETDGTIRLTDLRLEAPELRIVGGQGSYTPGGQISLRADAISDRFGRLGVRIAGTLADPQARITAERPDLGIGLANLEAAITGVSGGYRLEATAQTDYGPLTADVTLHTKGQLTLQINDGNLGGIEFAGTLKQTPEGPFAGTLTAVGSGLGGIVRLASENGEQLILVQLRADNARLPGPANFAIGSAIVEARVVLYEQPYIAADVQLANTLIGEFYLNAARLIVDYRGGRGDAKVLVEATSGLPFRVAANVDLQPEMWRALVRGRARGVEFKTATPMRIIPGEEAYKLLPSRIEIGDGSIRVAGSYGDGILIQSRLDSIDLSLVNAFLPGLGIGGSASGSLDFVQPDPGTFPRADARLKLDNFTRTTAATTSRPVDISLVGKLLPDGGELRAAFRYRGSLIGRMIASLRPLPPGAGPWTERLLKAPLDGGIRYNGPATTLFSLTGQTGQRLFGPIAVAADFSCRVADPCFTGMISGQRLTYVNEVYGTRLSDLSVVGRFTGNRLEIEQLTAEAGDGTVAASGFISLAAEAGYPMDISAKLYNARLARGEPLSAAATGELRLTKSSGETALLSGELRLPETRYEIIRGGAAEIPELAGVRFEPTGRQQITGDEAATSSGPGLFDLIRLDLDLLASEEVYVSGMGLESEWAADLHIFGTSAEPRLSGAVTLIRGTLEFAGKSFELQEGRITFTGGAEVNPRLAIVATDEIEDITVTVRVSGRAANPQIVFLSTPSLPQDEILARVLFGSSLANLSTLEAVQLAASFNTLRGSGGGLSPLGTLRAATGVDRLRVLGPDEETGRGTAVAAGQYLTDDVYIELVTDARGFTAAQIEVSLTPWLSILSQAGGSGVSNLNVRIKKNY